MPGKMLLNAFQRKKSFKSFYKNTLSSNDDFCLKDFIFQYEIFDNSQFQSNFDFEFPELCGRFGKCF